MIDVVPPLLSWSLAPPHSKAKGRRNASDEPVSLTTTDPSNPPTSPTSPNSASSSSNFGGLSWTRRIAGSKPAPPVSVSTAGCPSHEASLEQPSMLSPTKKKEQETPLVPIFSSPLEILSLDAGENELISTVESLPSSDGLNRTATQDSTLSTPLSVPIASGSTTAPTTVSTGSGKLTADARPFIPRRVSSSVVIKNTSGEEVDLRKLGGPPSSTATASGGSTARISAPVSKAPDEEEEKQTKRLAAIMEVHKRAEEGGRKKREEEEAVAIAKAKAKEEERARKEKEEAVQIKAEEEARRQAEVDAEKEALRRRIQEQEAELALLKAQLAAQSQSQQVQPVAITSLRAAGRSEGDQEQHDHEQVTSSTDDTGSVIHSDSAVQHEEEESQGEKEQEKHQEWSADPPHEVDLSYFPIASGPLTAPIGTFSEQQRQQQVPGQPLQKMGRERSRRGGRRDRNRTEKAEKGDEAPDPLKLQKSRSHEPRKRPAPDRLDLVMMQRSRTVHPALPSALSSAKNITDITIVVYPAGVRTPKPELNAQSRNGQFRCVILSLSDSVHV